MASPTRGHLTEQVASERRRTGARSRDRFRTPQSPALVPLSLLSLDRHFKLFSSPLQTLEERPAACV